MLRKLARIKRNDDGAMVIETAVVAPLLILMALGAFEVSMMVSRQQELQSAAHESEMIALTFAQGGSSDEATIKQIIMASVNLMPDQIQVNRRYRCGTNTSLVSDKLLCTSSQTVSEFLRLEIKDTYTPVWTQFGVGEEINYNLDRMVQVG